MHFLALHSQCCNLSVECAISKITSFGKTVRISLIDHLVKLDLGSESKQKVVKTHERNVV